MRIGIYGGTFNPVHHGHLRTALEVKEQFCLDQLRLTPCHIPAHRQAPDVTAEMRLTMLKLAIVNTPDLQIDQRELDRGGTSFMVDTLQSIASENPDATLILFMGSDAFSGLEHWRQWRQLFASAHIVVMTRPGFEIPTFSDFLLQKLCENKSQMLQKRFGNLFFQTVTSLDISATAIRKLILGGFNPQFLLPDAVIDYIRQHRLYLSSIQDIECKQNNY